MSGNTKSSTEQCGFTVAEVLIALVIGGIILSTFFVFSFSVLSSTVRNANEAELAVESQSILRSITEELRVSAGIRTTNTITDPSNPSGWTTSNPDLVLIIATPALSIDGNYIKNEFAGTLYFNEIVYFADQNRLYKRTLADASAVDNRLTTSCSTATPTCPQDVLLSDHFTDMDFIFYDQNNALTANPTLARSILVSIDLEKSGYRQLTTFNNAIRVTMRNNIL